jgi:hypothetical protein
MFERMWSLVTFLVVPVLAFEGIGPITAVKRSAHLFRERWGPQVTANVVIGGVSGLAVFLGIVAVGGGALIVAGGTGGAVAGAVLLFAGVLLAIAGGVVGGATRGVFGVALYRWVADDQAVGPFTASDLDSAARIR